MSIYLRVMYQDENGLIPNVVRRSFERNRFEFLCIGESMTLQSERDLTDINNVVAKYQRTGQLPLATKSAQYGDVTALNRPLAELIDESRAVLDEAGQKYEAKLIADEKAAADKLAADLAELEQFRKASQTQASQTQASQT